MYHNFIRIFLPIISGIALKPAIESIIEGVLPIREGSKVFASWRAPPISPVMFYYVFNLTNEERFLRGERM
jgi:hypothetical protein